LLCHHIAVYCVGCGEDSVKADEMEAGMRKIYAAGVVSDLKGRIWLGIFTKSSTTLLLCHGRVMIYQTLTT
jgi:hypothetical protein